MTEIQQYCEAQKQTNLIHLKIDMKSLDSTVLVYSKVKAIARLLLVSWRHAKVGTIVNL